MRYAQLKWPAPFIIAIGTGTAAIATIPHLGLFDLFLDSSTAILASLGAVIAGTRLIVGRLVPQGRNAWKLTVAILSLVALGEFSEPFTEAAAQQLRIDNIDDLLLLAVAPICLWRLAIAEPRPVTPRRWVLVGLALQILATGLDFFDDAEALGDSTIVATAADLAQLLSTCSYVLALSWASLQARLHARASSGATQDRLYPPAFIARRSPSANSPAEHIHRMCNQILWPAGDILAAVRNVVLMSSWPIVASVHAWKMLKVHGARVQWTTGKTKPEQFIEQVVLALRHRVPPVYYYIYEFYRMGQRRRAGEYLLQYESKEIARYLHAPRPGEPSPLTDKVDFARHCELHGLRHIPIPMVFDSGFCVSGPGRVNFLPQVDLFVKPVRGRSAPSAERWRSLGQYRFRNMHGGRMNAAALIVHVARLSRSQPYLIQPVILNHREISPLSAGALSTVLMLSCRNERGDFEVTNASFRMSVDPRSPVDSFQSGGIAASVDLRTGTLGFATDLGAASNTDWYDRHPLTGAPILDRQLPMWQDAINLAVRAHRVFHDHAVVGWDIAILDDGPCLVAAHPEPDMDVLQRTADAPIGSKRFGELLAYNLGRK